jgi:F0F1-type ATP synthase membrane subunit b/b'
MDVNVLYLISFIIFMFLAYRLGFKKASMSIHESIQSIKKTLDKTVIEKDQALGKLNDAKINYQALENLLKEYKAELNDRLENIQKEHSLELEEHITARKEHSQDALEQEQKMMALAFKTALMQEVFKEMVSKFNADPKLIQAYNEKSIALIQENPLTH